MVAKSSKRWSDQTCIIAGLLLLTFILLLSPTAAQSQVSPPPNDDYTNRIILSGTDITFTGTLAGATFEWNFGDPFPPTSPNPSQTVWWEWTPTQTCSVTVQVVNTSAKPNRNDALDVYTEIFNYDLGHLVWHNWGGCVFETNAPSWFFSFMAYAGTNYEIQLAGNDSANFTMRLVATNAPLILEPPKSQTITVGDSVLLTVIAAGVQKPFSYQWQFNGTNLPGETAPMLALENVATNQAGLYQVWVTSTNGYATLSSQAVLTITATDSAPVLLTQATGGSNQFTFAILGEVGRRYRILSSTDLANWSPERSFASLFYDPPAQSYFRSVIFNSSGSDTLGLPIVTQQKFFRATPFHAASEICNNRLKQIRFAAELLAYDNGLSFIGTYSVVDILPYFKNQQFPSCPTGTPYELPGAIEWDPSCSTGLHPFEEP